MDNSLKFIHAFTPTKRHIMTTFPIARTIDTASQMNLLGSMANRHGLIAGATGTGKTVTLRTMAEGFSRAGVPVFWWMSKATYQGLVVQAWQAVRLASVCKNLA